MMRNLLLELQPS